MYRPGPFTCRTYAQLRMLMADAGSHYWDADTRRFFRTHMGTVYATSDGAVWTETIAAGWDAALGRAAKAMRVRFYRDPADGRTRCVVASLYNGLRDEGASLPTQRRRALAAAKASRYDDAPEYLAELAG